MSTKTSPWGTAWPSPAPKPLAIIALGVLLACGGGGDASTATETESGVVALSGISPASVAVGGSVPRLVTITVVSGSAGALQWSSDNQPSRPSSGSGPAPPAR